MTNPECPREMEVLEAIRAAQWPELASAELLAHASSCTTCDELATVANALFADFSQTMRTAPVPSSGAVWWRAQRRARHEAIQRATSTVTALQVVSVIAAVVITIAVIGTMSLTNVDWQGFGNRFVSALPEIAIHWTMPLILAVGTCATLAPVAVYLAVARD